jgi:hypothetical protein
VGGTVVAGGGGVGCDVRMLPWHGLPSAQLSEHTRRSQPKPLAAARLLDSLALASYLEDRVHHPVGGLVGSGSQWVPFRRDNYEHRRS